MPVRHANLHTRLTQMRKQHTKPEGRSAAAPYHHRAASIHPTSWCSKAPALRLNGVSIHLLIRHLQISWQVVQWYHNVKLKHASLSSNIKLLRHERSRNGIRALNWLIFIKDRRSKITRARAKWSQHRLFSKIIRSLNWLDGKLMQDII